jgi:hypothetical protein
MISFLEKKIHQRPLFRLGRVFPSVLALTMLMISAYAKANRPHSAPFAPQGRDSSMFEQSKLELAVAQYQPLILCRILSSAESGKETRSYKTEYSILVHASTAGFESQRKSIWSYGGPSLEKGVHLVILGVGGRIDSSISIPAGKEKSGEESFNEAKSRMDGIKTKFLPLETFRMANEGKVDLVLVKVGKRNPMEHSKEGIYTLEVLEILSGSDGAEVQALMEGPEKLTVSAPYFIGLHRKGKIHRITAAKKTTPEEMEFYSTLYRNRLEFLKEPWSKKYAEP